MFFVVLFRAIYSMFVLTLWPVVLTLVSVASASKALLRNIEVLTFYRNEYTTGRRSKPLPQIDCERGCSQFTPDEVQCYNRGFDGFDVNWECKAQLPDGMRFSKVVVGCEGYDYPDDPYILRGSCQVVFTLSGGSYFSSAPYEPKSTSESGISWGGLFLIAGCGYLVFQIFKHFNQQQTGSYASSGTSYAAPQPSVGYGWGMPTLGSGYGYGQPGFWSGMGVGGILGSIFGR